MEKVDFQLLQHFASPTESSCGKLLIHTVLPFFFFSFARLSICILFAAALFTAESLVWLVDFLAFSRISLTPRSGQVV